MLARVPECLSEHDTKKLSAPVDTCMLRGAREGKDTMHVASPSALDRINMHTGTSELRSFCVRASMRLRESLFMHAGARAYERACAHA